MTYRLCTQSGDSIAVPQLIFAKLPTTEGNFVRVALYILASGSTDARDIAYALRLKSVREAENALQFWAGAGLLEVDRGAAAPAPAPAPLLTQEEMNLAALRDPMVSMLTSEAQASLGKAFGPKDCQRLVSLYVNDGWPVEVILLCCAHIAGQDWHTIAALDQELRHWRAAGVETGEDAEKHLNLLALRAMRETHVAEVLKIDPKALQLAERRMIDRWYEQMGFGDEMIDEAVLNADGKNEVRYLNGILKGWYGKGWRTLQDVRGGGALTGNNLRVDREAPSGNDFLRRSARRPLRLKQEE